jgi:hypothetical protein
MTDEIMKAKVGIDLKGGATGELALGGGFGGFLERFVPWARRSAVDQKLSSRILDKIERGETLTRADADFAEDKFGEAAGTYVRRMQIAGRAREVVASVPRALPTGGVESAPLEGSECKVPPITADEWIRRFWEDAGAVSDETLQEIYARVLANEAIQEGSSSTLVLRALRYMDRATAEAFNGILPYVLQGAFVPRDLSAIPISVLRDLDEAGLLDSGSSFEWYVQEPEYVAFGSNIVRIVTVGSGCNMRQKIPAHPLSRAGRQLARIADSESRPAHLETIGSWLHLHITADATLEFAELPSSYWRGAAGDLTWIKMPRASGKVQ